MALTQAAAMGITVDGIQEAPATNISNLPMHMETVEESQEQLMGDIQTTNQLWTNIKIQEAQRKAQKPSLLQIYFHPQWVQAKGAKISLNQEN